MGKVPRVACNSRCRGCPALPLTKEQYEEVIKQTFASNKPEDRELASAVLNMDVLFVWCIQQQQVCIFRIGDSRATRSQAP